MNDDWKTIIGDQLDEKIWRCRLPVEIVDMIARFRWQIIIKRRYDYIIEYPAPVVKLEFDKSGYVVDGTVIYDRNLNIYQGIVHKLSDLNYDMRFYVDQLLKDPESPKLSMAKLDTYDTVIDIKPEWLDLVLKLAAAGNLRPRKHLKLGRATNRTILTIFKAAMRNAPIIYDNDIIKPSKFLDIIAPLVATTELNINCLTYNDVMGTLRYFIIGKRYVFSDLDCIFESRVFCITYSMSKFTKKRGKRGHREIRKCIRYIYESE